MKQKLRAALRRGGIATPVLELRLRYGAIIEESCWDELPWDRPVIAL